MKKDLKKMENTSWYLRRMHTTEYCKRFGIKYLGETDKGSMYEDSKGNKQVIPDGMIPIFK